MVASHLNSMTTRILTLGSLFLLLSGCSPKTSDMLVARVGETPITLGDYENLYIKSNGSREQAASSTMEEREKFLGLMTNFRLKLADAYTQGLDRRPEVKDEIKQYKGSLTASYLTDREVTAPGIKKIFQRRQEEIRASHILFTLAPTATPEDSAAAYTKAYDVIRMLKAGASFDSLAVEYSQDPSAKQNRGDLYYFTGGQMVPAFEDAAYAMKVGEVSSTPIRTQFGLHIIKVIKRKPAPGEVQSSHIMIRFEKQDPTPEDTLAAYMKIKAIQDSIKAGVDFAMLAQRNSEDPGSAARGGDLGMFTRRRWVQAFDEVAVEMKPGQVSDIVRTIYGYHIIKCVDAKPPKTFEESQAEYRQLYQQTGFQDDYNKYLDRLKRETGYSLNEAVVSQFIASLDTNTSTRDTSWFTGIPSELGRAPMFKFTSRSISVDSVVGIIKNRPDMTNTPLRPASIRSSLDKVGEQLVYEVKSESIEREHPEFGAIMKEYTEGILLYQIEQDRVWNRIAVSDSALRLYHGQNKEKFKFPDRVDFSALKVTNDSAAQAFRARLVRGETFERLAAEDSARLNQPKSYQTIFKSGSSSLSAQTVKVLAAVAKALQAETELKLNLIAHYDTTGNTKTRGARLANARLSAIKNHLIKKLRVAENRLSTSTRLAARGVSDSIAAAMYVRVDLELAGRRPLIGPIEHAVLPPATDERSQHADSLTAGEYSLPFSYQNSWYIVRLNKKDPSRIKTFEEAGTEVSSAFQEYESKRLEREWLDGLKVAHPVVEYKEVLKHAFAPNN